MISVHNLISIIKSHEFELADRQGETELLKLSGKIKLLPPDNREKQQVEFAIANIIDKNLLSDFSDFDFFTLTNFISLANLSFQHVKLPKIIKNYLRDNLHEENETLKRALLIKLIVQFNRWEYSTTYATFFKDENRIVSSYPWIYADILANVSWFECVEFIKEIINVEDNFEHLVPHLSIWLGNINLSENSLRKAIIAWCDVMNNEQNKRYLINWAATKGLRIILDTKISQSVEDFFRDVNPIKLSKQIGIALLVKA